ncbi:unnamed protein product [Linum tenue]|uniref:F-box domain-containing protein n=1 Tax=Linum tenue TaxID=586396 RepID=A0AAV0JXS1_9ROSI|nr:unnamed protein product [Linum tenue]
MDNSSGESGEAVKSRSVGGNTTTYSDRLSHLPDFIIHHILSFVDTKCAVQTSVLSRGWRYSWKHVPVLILHNSSFGQYSSFERFVDNVLSLRHPFNVREMIYTVIYPPEEEEEEEEEEGEGGGEGEGDSQFVKLIKYAVSHDAHRLVLKLFFIMVPEDSYRFSDLFSTISNCRLKTLELYGVGIDSGFESYGFPMLTTLKLGQCLLASDKDGVFDPFSILPCLENLVLSHCNHLDRGYLGHVSRLKISGLRLLRLKLDSVWSTSLEIFAPRLKSFRFHHDMGELKFSKLSFPILDHAVIQIDDESSFMEEDKERLMDCVITLFQGLSNATTLLLDSRTVEVLTIIPEIIEQRPSPFTRLKTLIVKADSVPYTLLNYFLKGSSSTKPTLEFV